MTNEMIWIVFPVVYPIVPSSLFSFVFATLFNLCIAKLFECIKVVTTTIILPYHGHFFVFAKNIWKKFLIYNSMLISSKHENSIFWIFWIHFVNKEQRDTIFHVTNKVINLVFLYFSYMVLFLITRSWFCQAIKDKVRILKYNKFQFSNIYIMILLFTNFPVRGAIVFFFALW